MIEPATTMLTRVLRDTRALSADRRTHAIYLELDGAMRSRPWRSGLDEARRLALEQRRIVVFGITPEPTVFTEGGFIAMGGRCYLPLWMSESQMRFKILAEVLAVEPTLPSASDAEAGLRSSLRDIRHQVTPTRVSLAGIRNASARIPDRVWLEVIEAAVQSIEASVRNLGQLAAIGECMTADYVELRRMYLALDALLRQAEQTLADYREVIRQGRTLSPPSQEALGCAIHLLQEFEEKSRMPLNLNIAA